MVLSLAGLLLSADLHAISLRAAWYTVWDLVLFCSCAERSFLASLRLQCYTSAMEWSWLRCQLFWRGVLVYR